MFSFGKRRLVRRCHTLLCASTGKTRRTGKVVKWHPFERSGVIVDAETKEEIVIANTRAFETVLPTMLRTLDGATVTYEVDRNPNMDRVIIRSRLDPITEKSYLRKPPVDFLNPTKNLSSSRAEDEKDGEKKYAKNVVVDIGSIPCDKLARLSGPLVDDEVVAPTKNYKDMRSSRILDDETNEFLRLRRQFNSGEKAREEMARRRKEEEKRAIRREVVAHGVEGSIFAWSPLHRSGAVVEGLEGAPDSESAPPVQLHEGAAGVSVIRNVHCFESALPTSRNLLHRRVRYDKVSYSTQPGKFFAENIMVLGGDEFDSSAASPDEAREEKEKEKEMLKKQSALHFYDVEEPVEDDRPVPESAVYGVVTRWSGGQGTVESGDGRLYYIQSAADFTQLLDRDTHAVRGAVVTFRVEKENPRYAKEVNIVSTSTTSIEDMKPLLERMTPKRRETPSAEEGTVSLVPEGAEWLQGILLSWSAVEGQGIIHGDDGVRYVLRDPEEHVVAYKEHEKQLTKGRRVQFNAYGTTGRIACNVVTLMEEASEEEVESEELRDREKEQYSMDGNVNEAIASPMSTSYWLNRMDKAGYDTSEVKKMQNRALTMMDDDDDDGTDNGKFMDSEDLFKKDPWWNDPKKNIKFPNSDMTAGHLALIGPASMMNMALKAKDPKKLDKMAKKYTARLTEDQKEYAWKQAKEMAPKYEALIKKARERNEEPTFYFF
ncbi:hypothetical protein, conserved [Angomonas deanei]|uniref:Uncharacterized protein n=1 Tax=Angomonas deanei TaxID=59799 RepID=A0A7G2C800_9TRYP|nr:hypothetical protein, conserved [Angomonas deanei]